MALVKARDRLLAALGTKAQAPKMPEFAAKGSGSATACGAQAAMVPGVLAACAAWPGKLPSSVRA